jgi:hypothetical protein
LLIAQCLHEMAELLDAEGANPCHAINCRSAADRLARLPQVGARRAGWAACGARV